MPETLLHGLRNRLEFVVLVCVETLALAIPPRLADVLARAAARLYFRLDGRRRRTAIENVRVAFGDTLGPEARETLARRSCEHVFLTLLDLGRQPRFVRSLRSLRRRVRLAGDHEAFFADARAGRAGLLLSAHVGNWELAHERLRREHVPVAIVARPIRNSVLEARAVRLRGGPASVIRKQGAVRDTLRAVRAGTWVAILADQNAGRHGTFVPFFGVPASTYPFAASLAVREGLPVYMGATRRVGPGFHYEMHMRRYVPDPAGDRRAEERRLLETYTRHVEAWVRETPEQYVWMHRRWKTRPRDEPDGPHLPAYDKRCRIQERQRALARAGARPG